VDITSEVSALRHELQSGEGRGMTRLAELASRYANNRDLVYRAVLLKREFSRAQEPPSARQIDEGLAILDALLADSVVATANPGDSRHVVAERARERALAIEVPHATVFECQGLTKSFRRSDFALIDVSIDVRYGEILGIVGRNGNGKTTLLRLITGELSADAGSIRFPALEEEGRKLRWRRVRREIAYVPQDIPAWHGSLRANLHYEAAIHGSRGADNRREVDYIAERLGLANELDKAWYELSGGYRLRFALARALVWKPKLLVLDEPLANLDFVAQQVVLKDLRHLSDSLRYPLAVLISSQHVHEVEEVSDKLLLLKKGAVNYFGPVQGIGASRTVNVFEITGDVELDDLQRVLNTRGYHSVYYNGVAYVLTTAMTVTPEAVLRRLIEQKVPITYFRDISRSAKSLMQTEASEG
jgi:ABC-2 type transport system ATP-binding protein